HELSKISHACLKELPPENAPGIVHFSAFETQRLQEAVGRLTFYILSLDPRDKRLLTSAKMDLISYDRMFRKGTFGDIFFGSLSGDAKDSTLSQQYMYHVVSKSVLNNLSIASKSKLASVLSELTVSKTDPTKSNLMQ